MLHSILRSKKFLGSLLVTGLVLVPVTYSPAKGFTTTEACADEDCCMELRSICDAVLVNYYYSLRGCKSKIFTTATSGPDNT